MDETLEMLASSGGPGAYGEITKQVPLWSPLPGGPSGAQGGRRGNQLGFQLEPGPPRPRPAKAIL